MPNDDEAADENIALGTTQEAETDRYAWLRQRTYLFLREQGGRRMRTQ